MNTTREKKKIIAIELMKRLKIFEPYIDGFKNFDNVCCFENYGGFWAYQEPKLMEKVKEFEQEEDCLVYAVTHEYLEFGECYSFLIIPDYEEDWDYLLSYYGNGNFIVYAYVWNKSIEWCSEFGSIAVKSFGGGIKRIE